MTSRWIKFLALAAPLAMTGCGGSSAPSSSNGTDRPIETPGLVLTPKSLLTLENQRSCSAVSDYISDAIADLVLNVGLVACPSCNVTFAGGAETSLGVPGTARASFDAFSGTNNQVAGVDELDVIETDAAGHFYLIDGRHVVIANGLPPENLRQIASLEIDAGRRAEGLLLDAANDRLVVVLSRSYFFGPQAQSLIAPVPWEPITELLFIDVADPANPVIDRRLKIEGYRLAVRRIDDRVHVVSHWTPVVPASIWSDADLLDLRQRLSDALEEGDPTASIRTQIRQRVDSLVAGLNLSEFLPTTASAEAGEEFADTGLGDCSDVAIPDVTMPLAFTSVTSVDSNGLNADTLKIVNNSWQVFASNENFYLSQLSGNWWFAPNRQRQQTAIYKIEIGAGAPAYRATGVVDGWAGSSFQFSEHDGYLRVVTNRWERDPALEQWFRDNNLYVLADDGIGSLNVVGSVTGFGEQEQIFSTRFVGDRAFVVTFRQIDPLFAFDLSIPEDPRLVGELEIPGVSTYIHPLDDAHLLTIGFDGDETQLNGDFQLQIFDVQNLDDPRLIHRYVPQFDEAGFAWTSAIHDHLAFNYFPEAGTLTVPVQYYASTLDRHFSGFIAFSVDTIAGFAELGRLDHSDIARAQHCDASTGNVPSYCSDGRYLESAHPKRSVTATIDDRTYIYTLSS
ncbi:MAG: beta-propeller domain-containing protein, partial [Gammaproteobacteria bacterium]|nr:beta-propeller domain-containing protein [Gammaproteobacteria bacterium]